MDLPPRRLRFVEEYLKDLNATQAAIRAGYDPEFARQEGSRLLTFADIQEKIADAMEKRSQRTAISQDRVLKEIARLAFASMDSFMNWGPNGIKLRSKKKLTDDDKAAVAELSQTTTAHGGTIKLKLHDKNAALEKLMRHLGMGKDLPPLELILAGLPADISEVVRKAIITALDRRGSAESVGE